MVFTKHTRSALILWKTTIFGFPRKLRLLSKSDYARVFARSTRYSDSFWIVLVHRNDTDTGPRLGLAIAKKRARRAADRNRLKRVAREAFRHQQSRLLCCHLVIMNRDGAAGADTRTLRQALDRLLNTIAEKGR